VSPRSPGRIGIGIGTATAGRNEIEAGIAIGAGADEAATGIRTVGGEAGVVTWTVITSADHPETVLATS
jgi:hypothetical protein